MSTATRVSAAVGPGGDADALVGCSNRCAEGGPYLTSRAQWLGGLRTLITIYERSVVPVGSRVPCFTTYCAQRWQAFEAPLWIDV
jgi:hypothetical protein